uniref:Uncharacterized protein n=1 Tax=Arundo donax TaxID=35708 RepID=A0A0A8Z1X0_ARUDO
MVTPNKAQMPTELNRIRQQNIPPSHFSELESENSSSNLTSSLPNE